jgi:hypothetical protein
MRAGRYLLVAAFLVLAAARLTPPAQTALPGQLTADEFWALSHDLSEAGGTFRSDNLLSNERQLQHVIPTLTRVVPEGQVYLGVGPEQNFTYISALRPSLAFIVDIRRGNLQLHLMYKALFAVSTDRADFVSRLFSRLRPPGVGAAARIEDIFAAVAAAPPSPTLLTETAAAMRVHLTETLRLPVTQEDLQGIARIHEMFFANGPAIQYSANFARSTSFPTYAELMTATDAAGVARSFLASGEAYEIVRSLQERHLIVPIVGDFAGDKALRAVGRYLDERRATIGAFYLSNVEQYLGRDGRWHLFCQNVAALPLQATSTFIRSIRDGNYGRGMGLISVTGRIVAETKGCEK